MVRTINQKRSTRTKGSKKGVEGVAGFPTHLRKKDCIYEKGVITSTSHGIYIVDGDNDMTFIATARRLEQKRLNIMIGDQCVLEIPVGSLDPKATKQRARIVWRILK